MGEFIGQNRKARNPAIQEMVGDMPKEEVLARCQEANLPFSPIARPEDMFEDAQLNEGGGLLETTLPNGRKTKLPKIAIRLDDLGRIATRDGTVAAVVVEAFERGVAKLGEQFVAPGRGRHVIRIRSLHRLAQRQIRFLCPLIHGFPK